jgi:hypothetical protein
VGVADYVRILSTLLDQIVSGKPEMRVAVAKSADVKILGQRLCDRLTSPDIARLSPARTATKSSCGRAKLTELMISQLQAVLAAT